MKKYLFLLTIILLSSTKITAQQDTAWAPPGATWTYDVITMTTWSVYQMKYVKDTTINNTLVKQIRISDFTSFIAPPIPNAFETFIGYEYLYESGDTIYWLVNNTFEPLYIFSAQVGDKWEISKYPTATYQCDATIISDSMIVDNIVDSNYNGVWLQNIVASSVGKKWSVGTIVKGIGGLTTPFPQMEFDSCNIIDGAVGSVHGLICYYDSIRGYINFGSSLNDCDVLLSVNTKPITVKEPLPSIKIYPNPAYEQISFDLPYSKQWDLWVFDVTGKVVLQKQNITNNQLNISTLQQGVYYLRFRNNEGEIFNTKLMKL